MTGRNAIWLEAMSRVSGRNGSSLHGLAHNGEYVNTIILREHRVEQANGMVLLERGKARIRRRLDVGKVVTEYSRP